MHGLQTGVGCIKKVIKVNCDYSGHVDQSEPPILYLITIYQLENSDLKVINNEIIHEQNTKEIIDEIVFH